MAEDVIDPTYLPFTAEQLRAHFLVDRDSHIAYFQRSAQAYRDFIRNRLNRQGIPIKHARGPCQIEKDERFWTATAMKRLVQNPAALQFVLSDTFGQEPPLPAFRTWAQCVEGRLALGL